jgi:hypothetical protein
MNFRFNAVLAVALLSATAAFAGPREDVLHDFSRCAQIADNAKRLACFDALAPRVKQAVAPASAPAVPPLPGTAAPMVATAPPPAPVPAPVENPAPPESVATAAPPAPPASEEEQKSWFGRNVDAIFGTAPEQQTTPEKFGADSLPEQQQQANAGVPKVIDSITAKLADYAFAPRNKFIVFLDNGQVWRQLGGDDGKAHFRKAAKDNFVKISRGFMGTYDLRLNGTGLIFKVMRVR